MEQWIKDEIIYTAAITFVFSLNTDWSLLGYFMFWLFLFTTTVIGLSVIKKIYYS